MSIRFRLNALFIALLLLALMSSVIVMVVSAGPRIRAENDSIKRLGVEFVETAIASLQGTPDPGERLKVLLEHLGNLRHVNIYREGDLDAAKAAAKPVEGEAPAWLNALAEPSPAVEMPVRVNGQDFGTLIIAPRADHEAAEIWESIETTVVVGGLLAIATVLAMSLLVGHLLKPIKTVGEALLQLDSGRYDVAVPEEGPPEIADICRKLNRLTATLDGTISENRRLAQRIVFIQDEERKELARELHDELGPYMFAVRAAVTALKGELQRGGNDRAKLLASCDTIVERMEMIQSKNRRVLHKLRPIGLDEFGLKAKLKSLVALLQEDHLEMTINLDVDDAVSHCDETSNLTIYRVVQEGLTNALKHAQATVIDVGVEIANAPGAPAAMQTPGQPAGQPVVRVTICDDGRGLPDGMKPGYGIAGMSERVRATGGDIKIGTASSGGVALEARIPVALERGTAAGGRMAV